MFATRSPRGGRAVGVGDVADPLQSESALCGVLYTSTLYSAVASFDRTGHVACDRVTKPPRRAAAERRVRARM
eukprot:421643-Prymnesium_polylepis.4